jgi:hypothetical protein
MQKEIAVAIAIRLASATEGTVSAAPALAARAP